ncbi:hypothetical protein A5865_001090 [Enterococcus sp. 12E11_DIV0728]|nr:hypothetical protein A5865_001090 [Enterococcus sp. 12E11_DIV0728]
MKLDYRNIPVCQDFFGSEYRFAAR